MRHDYKMQQHNQQATGSGNENEFMELTEDYLVTDYLGSGAYGTVCAVKHRKTEEIVAIKKCKKVFDSKTLAKRTLREVRLLRYIDHPNIIKLKSVLEPININHFRELYIVFELMDTDLAQIIRSPQVLNVDHVQFFAYQLLLALEFLHSANIIHRDIKPRNILVNADCTLKLADFGLARWFPNSSTIVTSLAITDYVTTRWYRAPEILSGWTQYGTAVDMWAVGCIIAELFVRHPLFPGADTLRQLEKICGSLGRPEESFIKRCHKSSKRQFLRNFDLLGDKSIPDYLSQAPRKAVDLVVKLLDLNPANRPTARECLKHPFIHSYCSEPNATSLQIPLGAFKHENEKYTIDSMKDELFAEILFHKGGNESSTLPLKEEDDLASFETDAQNIGFSDVASSLVMEESCSPNRQELFVSQSGTNIPPKEIGLHAVESSSPFGLFVTGAPLDTVDLNISEICISEKQHSQTSLAVACKVQQGIMAINEHVMSRETIVEDFQSVPVLLNTQSESFDLNDANSTRTTLLHQGTVANNQDPLIRDEGEKLVGSVSIASPEVITIKTMKTEDRCFSNFDFTMCGTDASVRRGRNRAIEKPKQKSPMLCVIS